MWYSIISKVPWQASRPSAGWRKWGIAAVERRWATLVTAVCCPHMHRGKGARAYMPYIQAVPAKRADLAHFQHDAISPGCWKPLLPNSPQARCVSGATQVWTTCVLVSRARRWLLVPVLRQVRAWDRPLPLTVRCLNMHGFFENAASHGYDGFTSLCSHPQLPNRRRSAPAVA